MNHPLYPRPNLRKIVQRKSAFMGDVRVGEEGDVGDAVIFGEEILLREMLLHHFECGPAAVAF